MSMMLPGETVNDYALRMAEAHRQLLDNAVAAGDRHAAIAFCQCEPARAYREAKRDPRYVSSKPKPGRNLYLVISWDEDEQQPFWDIVPANDEEEARLLIGRLRGDYADIVDVLSKKDFALVHRNILRATIEDREQEYQDQLAEVMKLDAPYDDNDFDSTANEWPEGSGG